PEAGQADFVTDLAQGSELSVYFQSPSGEEVAAVRQAAEAAGLLGRRIFVDQGDFKSLHLADNLAGALLIPSSVAADVAQQEILRVLHPEGKAIIGEKEIVKPFPIDTDVWSHPHHGADNNPQSTDRRARWPGLTQFLAEPMFCPMPEVSVAAGGRVYRAFGHIAHKANQNAMLNTLLCVNGYNGTILWERKLKEGFMIHRNTMIATPDTLYLGDDESCQLIDVRSGKIKDRIVISDQLADGPVWKWMALEDGVLVALLGGKEVKISTQSSPVPGMGHWPWGMWEGHDYKDPKTNFGFGRTLLAIDPKTKKTLWTHREDEYIDSRGVCMKNGRLYFYSPEKFLGCLDARTGKILWKTSAAELLEAIGPNGPAQLWVTGYSTTTYIKCNEKYVFFAGPQRARLVVASAEDGKLVWQKDHGNYQLVLRDDGFYAAGPQASGCKLDYETGKVLVRLPHRRACTRATGSIDSVFYRTSGGTVRIPTDSNVPQHIAPMRPACQDGVIISDGHLYWGPWMCGCQLSLYGHICLAPAGDFDFHPAIDDSRLKPGQGDPTVVQKLEVRPGDWPAYGGDAFMNSYGNYCMTTNEDGFVSDPRLDQEVRTGAADCWTGAAGNEVRPFCSPTFHWRTIYAGNTAANADAYANPRPDGELNAAPVGMGYLLDGGYLGDARTYFCPTAGDSMEPDYNHWNRPTGSYPSVAATTLKQLQSLGGFDARSLSHGNWLPMLHNAVDRGWGGSPSTGFWSEGAVVQSNYNYRL
ncbi:MAG: PQQ-binding-like beta-propeller repeat protein, partial [Planctomycetes bacterium]|nr:PQQ-binding-like beta-propeller repeat protein [Planctomycetota bacterium]